MDGFLCRRYYQLGAIMLGEEATELCGVLLGLNSIDFGYVLRLFVVCSCLQPV